MPFISPDDGYLTVFNLFDTPSPYGQDRLLEEMRDIIDNARYPGWVSSTLHAGQDRLGTANYVQWDSEQQLDDRYAGEKFRHKTVPVFDRLSTGFKLLKTEVVHGQRHPSLGATVEISPRRDDYTVITVFGVSPENQKALVDILTQPEEWLLEFPGYRSHSILRGIDGSCVVNYAQWESKEAYDRFHTLPEDQRPADVRAGRVQARGLMTSRDSNTYRVVHTRSVDGEPEGR